MLSSLCHHPSEPRFSMNGGDLVVSFDSHCPTFKLHVERPVGGTLFLSATHNSERAKMEGHPCEGSERCSTSWAAGELHTVFVRRGRVKDRRFVVEIDEYKKVRGGWQKIHTEVSDGGD
jgi:hypothetical protein